MAVKITTIYDKLKQLVSINSIYTQIVNEQSHNLRAVFEIPQNALEEDSFQRDLGRIMGDKDALAATDAEIMQDLLTRKIL